MPQSLKNENHHYLMYNPPIYLIAASLALFLVHAQGTTVDDFESDTLNTQPAAWSFYSGTPASAFWVVEDPTNVSNKVLDTSDYQATVGGVPASIGSTEVATLQFSFYLQGGTDADLSVGMASGTVSSLGNVANGFGPTIRLVNGNIDIAEGDGSGGATFNNLADQAVTVSTWYTINMVIDNASDTWSATIVGGDYETATALTHSGSDGVFGFRTSTSTDLTNFVIRGNVENVGSNGVLLDNISVIPEPSYAALLMVVGCSALFLKRRC